MGENKGKGKGELCDICGTNMTDETRTTVIGMSIRLEGDHKEIRRVERRFGKTEFKICYVCLLKALGVKEIRKEIGPDKGKGGM